MGRMSGIPDDIQSQNSRDMAANGALLRPGLGQKPPVRVQPGELRVSLTALDLSQADPLQQLHFQTIRELVRERDEAVIKAALATDDEREALDSKVEMLELALEEARAEYVANYDVRAETPSPTKQSCSRP